MKFQKIGGRGGHIKFEHKGRAGVLDWEMLLGESAMVIYSTGCNWVTSPGELMVMPEILEVVQIICNETKFQIEIQFENRIEVLKPK